MTTIGTITLDGSFTDWLAAQSLENPANASSNYQIYGALINDPTLGENYVIGLDATGSTDPVIAAGTVIYLNTDQNNTTGFSPFGVVGAEYEVQFAADTSGALQAYLYSVTAAGVTTPLNGGAPLASGFSSDSKSVELAIPQMLLTPTGGTAPTAINFSALINGSTGLPTDFSNPASDPEYVIPDPTAVAPPPTTIGGVITLDGSFADWPAADSVMTPGNSTPGTSDANYQVYGALLSDPTLGKTYTIGIDATNSADAVISAGTTIYLNTDQNSTTGYSPFGSVGAEYEVQFQYGSNGELEPFLYSVTSAGVTTELNNDQPLPFGVSSDGKSVELGIQQSLLTPSGGAAPTSINFAALINNGAAAVPQDFSSEPQFTITDPTTLVPVDHSVKKVGIVYSATSAALYFGLTGQAAITAYDDLFMSAQHQAEAAGVSYDILTEADLTNVAKLSQYSALIFPDFQDVQSSQVAAISSALSQVVYNYHVPIITGGEFMTNDETGAALPGNPFSNMTNLLNVTQSGFGTATYSVTPDATALANNNPVMAGYTSGELIGGASGQFPGDTPGLYTNTGYLTFSGVTQPATTLADINIQGGGSLPGVVQTTTGGTNTVFATTGLEGDSNLLQHAIQNAVFGTTPSLAMDITRFKGVVNSRTDMDQSQFPSDVSPSTNGSPAGTPGIYDEMIPILASLNQQYDFVGSYYINIGDNANPANANSTNWAVSTPYYDQLLEMGNEIGTHSYTHLIAPPTTTVTAATSVEATPGSTQITVSTLPSYNGATVGMIVTDANGDFGPNTIVSAVSGNATTGYVLTLLNQPGGFGTPNAGVIGDVKAGTALTFGVPTENTNFLGTGTGPFTYNYEFGQSAAIEGQQIGITIAGAAVPGATEVALTSAQIEQYFQTSKLPAGLTGYVSGGWTGVGSGSPNAFGYIDPSNTGSVYIAPNITFDFSELQYENKTPAQSLADWENLFNQMSANSATPVLVWPWHDYGITNWPTDGVGTAPPGYSSNLYSGFIADAYNAGYEFVTSEDLAQRIAAEQAATLKETTSGNVITATVTPAASEPDLGAMALNVTNGAVGQVIQNAGSWYAYDSNSVFLANDTPATAGATPSPETFTVTLGATQDDVTHVDSLPMRADLQSVSGDGSNLTLAMTGDGTVDFHVKTPGTNIISVQASVLGTLGAGATAPTATLVGDDLKLVFNDGALAISSTSPQGVSVHHDVTITEGPTAVAGATFVFFAPPTIAGTHATPTASDAAVNPFSGVTVGDLNTGATDALMITLSNGGTTGALTGTGLSGGTNGVYTLSGSAATVTSELDALLFTPAKGAPGSVTTTTFALSDLSSGFATPTSDSITTVTDSDLAQPAITSASYTGSASTGHWILAGAAAAGSTVTIYDGTTSLGTTLATVGGTWSFPTTRTSAAIRVFTVTATLAGQTSVASAPYYEGTGNADVFSFVSEAALSAAALINGGGGTDTLKITAPATLTDADFAHAQAIEILGLTGASSVTLGSNASAAGITTVTPGAGATSITDTNSTPLTINATGLGAGNLLTLAGSTAVTVTNLTGNLSAASDTGALTVTATAAAAQAIATGSGATLINDSNTAGSVVVDATALATNTLTIGGDVTTTVNNLAGNLVMLSTGSLIVSANGSGNQTVTTGIHATSITDNGGGSMTVNNASGFSASYALTLSGSAAETVINLSDSLVATGLTGALNVTTKTTALSIATGAGPNTINAGAMTGALTLTGSTAATVSALGGNLNATGDSGALTVTTTGAAQAVTTGSGNISIADNSTGLLTVNGAALAAGSLLTLAGSGAVTVTNLKGGLNATGDTGAISLTATATTAQNITTGSGAMSITDSAAGGSVVIDATALGTNTLTLSGSAAKTVTNTAGSLVLTGAATVNAISPGSQSVTTNTGAVTITDNSGSLNVNAGTGALTLKGSAITTVTALGSVNATGDSGALTVTTNGVNQTVTTGSGNIKIADNSTGTLTINATALGASTQTVTTGANNASITENGSGSLAVNATALGTNMLTLAGSAAKTVTNTAGSLVVIGAATVNATSPGSQSVTTTTGAVTITDTSGSLMVNAGTGALTLNGSATTTVTASGNVNATNDSGALTVTTTGATETVTTGSGNISITDNSTGVLTINAAALSVSNALTLAGAGTATVSNLKGSLNATGDSGTISLTANGTGQTVTTGSGNMTIADSTSALTVNAAALSVGNTLTLSGSTAKTVNGLQGNLVATGAAPISVTAGGAGPQSITTGAGADTIVDQTSGGDTITGGGGADSINVAGHAGADSFTYSATTDSRNTTAGHDTIAGFGSSDLLNFSTLNANLHIGALQAAGSQIAADSIAWVNTGSAMDVYINDTGAALATTNITNAGLMEITLTGVSSLSASNFHA
jgi:hypothetical protein